MTAQSPVKAPLAPRNGAGGQNTSPIKIKTNRGNLSIDPKTGAIDGLWRLCQRELRTAAQVRRMCGWRDRSTMAHHRARDFPAPVLVFPAKQPTELWSRSEVQSWLRKRKREAESDEKA